MASPTYCLECDQQLENLTYAVYQTNSNKSKVGEQDEQIIGYLCDQCRKKHKMKPLIKKTDHLKVLEKLKQQLIEQ